MGMRTVSIRSDGDPVNTRIRDKETGQLIDDIKHVEFSDLHVKTSSWVAILHRYTDRVVNDEFELFEEQVYIEVGQ
jgi:hypothetical protein